ncbi:ATP-binding cassette domain-containing protein [Clostridium sp. MCC353]|uniref:ABC transporter ATP-binding protein n=1 Tax=Clostridium sp. MCC353 TaxID=2592646 RepID=UPI001C03798C|nr:ABC transporter ATP-binding protein [Clostridium sp. MCC353]MBT9779721.1 ATP-binding cassette domain-containing protein [Clostridium sp. MCC353]
MEPLIEIKGLKKYFKTPAGLLHAVDDVNLSIAKGETLGVVGESGCGKSTLGRVIIKLLEPTEGSILFNGTDIAKMKNRQLKEFRRDAQIIFQDPYASLNPRMSVFDLIAEPMIVNHMGKSKGELRDQVLELMETVGLAPRLASAYPHELDGGRRQRIGVAHALAVNPKFIVCDEPVSALDVSIQAQILNLLMDLQEKRNLTYLFITHDLSVVKHISNEIAVMYLGQCVEKAPAEELFANPLHPYTKALLEAIPVPNLKNRGKVREVLTGEVTNPINPGIGCRFAPRCRFACEQCTNSSVRLKEYSKGHQAACILYE